MKKFENKVLQNWLKSLVILEENEKRQKALAIL